MLTKSEIDQNILAIEKKLFVENDPNWRRFAVAMVAGFYTRSGMKVDDRLVVTTEEIPGKERVVIARHIQSTDGSMRQIWPE